MEIAETPKTGIFEISLSGNVQNPQASIETAACARTTDTSDHNDIEAGRPIPWLRHQFVPIPKEIRKTLDPNEVVTPNVLCKNCTSLAEEIDRVHHKGLADGVHRPPEVPSNPSKHRLQDSFLRRFGRASSRRQPSAGQSTERRDVTIQLQIAQEHGSDWGLVDRAKAGCYLCTHIANKLDKYFDIIPFVVGWEWSYSITPDRNQLRLAMKMGPLEGSVSSKIDLDILEGDEITMELRVEIEKTDRRPNQLPVSVTTMSDEHISLGKSWIQQCFAEHAECWRYECKWMPTRLIEILDSESVRLVETKLLAAPVPYYALSYCWGLIDVLTTESATLDIFKTAIPFDDIPLTIQDTINVVHRMGGRYLWVDSLCIIQDNEDDWKEESATMCEVYQNAYLTIVALGATGATEGLFTRRDPLAIGDCALPSTSTYARIIPEAKFLDRSFNMFSASTLQFRGWAFQERALAPRKLFFSSYLVWECTSAFKQEYENHQWQHSDLWNRTLLPSKPVTSSFAPDHFGCCTIPEYLADWYTDLQDYSGRDLTKAKDRLIAFSGVITYLERKWGRESRFGMWLDFFLVDVLWKLPNARVEGRRLEGAPTWSWASLTARVMRCITVGKPFMPLEGVRIKEYLEEEKVLVVEGRLVRMRQEVEPPPLPRMSERDCQLRMLVGAGRERKMRALFSTDHENIPDAVGNEWSVCDMQGIVNCTATLDLPLHDSIPSTDGSSDKLLDIEEQSYFMLPLALQASPHFSKDAPLVHCHGLAVKPSGTRGGYYERVGVFEIIFDMQNMGIGRRSKFGRWKTRMEEPRWPRDSWRSMRLV